MSKRDAASSSQGDRGGPVVVAAFCLPAGIDLYTRLDRCCRTDMYHIICRLLTGFSFTAFVLSFSLIFFFFFFLFFFFSFFFPRHSFGVNDSDSLGDLKSITLKPFTNHNPLLFPRSKRVSLVVFFSPNFFFNRPWCKSRRGKNPIAA